MKPGLAGIIWQDAAHSGNVKPQGHDYAGRTDAKGTLKLGWTGFSVPKNCDLYVAAPRVTE